MGSKGRFPDPYQRHPAIDHGMVHSDPYGPPMHPQQRGGFPPMDRFPPVEAMEQKLATQHGEMQKLATENQRLATTHGTLRQELGAAQHELQMLHSHIREMKSDSEQQRNGLMDNVARMGAELKASEPINGELQKAKAEAQNLIATRHELVAKCQQLDRELQIAHTDVQQIPVLLSELNGLRQEYQHCRATYDYEKKAYNDHLESLQVMEKNYLAMEGEVEKLRTQLANASKFDPRAGAAAYPGYNENAAAVAAGNYSNLQNAYATGYGYGHGYGGSQGQGHILGGASGGGAADASGTVATGATPPPAGAQSMTGGPASAALPPPPPVRGVAAAYDGSVAPNYDTQRGGAPVPGYAGGPGYDPQRGAAAGVAAAAGGGYDVLRGGPGYDTAAAAAAQWRMSYDGQQHQHHQPQYDAQRGSVYEPQRAARYDVPSGGGGGGSGPQGQVVQVHNVAYGSVTPPAHVTGVGYEAMARGGANVRR